MDCPKLILAAITFTALMSSSGRADSLKYFAPGDVLPQTSLGIKQRQVTFSNWMFPMKVGTATGLHAYIGTQLSAYHGLDWSNDPRLFNYPHRDNQCEPRPWAVGKCPSGKGHQGVDIRANDNKDNHWEVLAVEDGVVTSVTSNTTVAIRAGEHTVRYLHMHPQSISAAGIRPGIRVRAGQVIGKVSCYMESSCSTSRHLHFDAYTGTAGQGNFYHVYPSLIAAYRRAWALSDGVSGGELVADAGYEVGQSAMPVANGCDSVALSPALSQTSVTRFDSIWLHNCSKIGVVTGSGQGRYQLVYHQPKTSLVSLVSQDPVLFSGVNTAGRLKGKAAQYSSRCGTQRFDVEGMVEQRGDEGTIELAGRRDKRDTDCRVVGQVDERLRFTFLNKLDQPQGSTEHPIPSDRITLSEVTRNFLAITFYPDNAGVITVLPYFKAFPGYSVEDGKVDSAGGLIPALSTDEAGAGISWVWILKRARFTQGISITPRSVAFSMAGVDPAACSDAMDASKEGIEAASGIAVVTAAENNAASSLDAARSVCDRVVEYLRGYIGYSGGRNFAADYFSRQVQADERLDLSQPDVRWNWMRTMYSHESGRAPVVTREAFDRGVRLGEDFIAEFYDGQTGILRDLAYYSNPCSFAPLSCNPSTGSSTGDNLTSAIDEVGEIRDRMSELERKLIAISVTQPAIRAGALHHTGASP